MGYSIFQNTMVDMTFPQIQEAVSKGAVALLPVSVVEEHGPHLCTGTDIYLTENICEKIQINLSQKGKTVLIAPPFYWGINSITNDFPGSFSISPQLMEDLVLEIIKNLNRWGIKKIFMLNFHGDFVHINKIAEIAKKAFNDGPSGVYFIAAQSTFSQFGLTEPAPYFLKVPLSQESLSSTGGPDMDIHAGALETSWMLLHYRRLVNTELASQMTATNLSLPELRMWLHGGPQARKLTPLGYCGNPARMDIESIQTTEEELVEAFSSCLEPMI